MNVQGKIKIFETSFSPELYTCESEELRQRGLVECNDILCEFITHFNYNKVNAWFALGYPSFRWRSV